VVKPGQLEEFAVGDEGVDGGVVGGGVVVHDHLSDV
jgi:hypothetical protein